MKTLVTEGLVLSLLQIYRQYAKQRREFGRHPHFTDEGAEASIVNA